MTDQIVYHHASGASVSLVTNDVAEIGNKEGTRFSYKNDKGNTVINDPNRAYRTFSFSSLVPTATKNTLYGYFAPASATTKSATYPKIVWSKAGGTTETILVLMTGYSAKMVGDDSYVVQLTFQERYQSA